MVIEPGYNTDQPIRERGWTHWHHFFNPRQLLVLGSFVKESIRPNSSKAESVMSLLGVMKSADHDSKLSGWSPLPGKELVDHVFANQALNTLSNHGVRAILHLETSYVIHPEDRASCRKTRRATKRRSSCVRRVGPLGH
jgi:adenine-specific DNA methylase